MILTNSMLYNCGNHCQLIFLNQLWMNVQANILIYLFIFNYKRSFNNDMIVIITVKKL